MGFIFGGTTGKTPEDLARERALAEALLARGSTGVASNVGEGLAQLGQALAGRMGMARVNGAERQNQSAAQKLFDAAMGSVSGGAGGPAPPAGSAAAAPTAALPTSSMTGDKQAFIKTLTPAVLKASQATGIDPRIILAQAAQESGWGGHAPGNNLFGIKSHGVAGGNTLATNEVINGQPVRTNASFRAYDSPDASVAGYADFINANPRYAGLKGAKGLDNQLAALQQSGYATDPNYAASVGGIARSIDPNSLSQPMAPPNIMPAGAMPQEQMQAMPAGGPPTPDMILQRNMLERGKISPDQIPNMADVPRETLPEQIAAPPPPAEGLGGPAPGAQQQPSMQALAQALSNPYLNEGQRFVLQSMWKRMEDQMAPPDPLKALQQQKAQLELEQLRNPKVDPMDALRLEEEKLKIEQMRNPKPKDLPGAVQEYEYAKGQGFKGTFQDWEASKKGGMSLQVDPSTGAVSFQQGGNIKPLTEGQSKDATFYTRMKGAAEVFDPLANSLADLGSETGGKAPIIGNYLKSDSYRQAEQAGKEWLAPMLRKDTGAAVTPQEFVTYGSTYLPQAGDDEQTLANKAAARARALEAVKAGMTPQAILQAEQAVQKSAGGKQDSESPATQAPKPGDIQDGFRFKGGDPGNQDNWELVK